MIIPILTIISTIITNLQHPQPINQAHKIDPQLLAARFFETEKPTPKHEEFDLVVLVSSNWYIDAVPYVAQKLGYFKTLGLNVKIIYNPDEPYRDFKKADIMVDTLAYLMTKKIQERGKQTS